MSQERPDIIFRHLADLVLAAHFVWIAFMISGVALAAGTFRWRRLLKMRLFRTFHLFGMLYTGLLAALGRPCPLTMLENRLYRKAGLGEAYQGSFISEHIGRLVYLDVPAEAITIPTVLLAVFTAAVFFRRPPGRLSALLRLAKRGR